MANKVITIWYRLVAYDLFKLCNTYKRQFLSQIDVTRGYMDELRKECREKVKLNNTIAALKEHPLKATLDTVRSHAAQQRIQDLEDEVKHLSSKNKNIDIIRQQLAYIIYLEEQSEELNLADFNSLPTARREHYFKQVDNRVQVI